jgi:hypothetical protein
VSELVEDFIRIFHVPSERFEERANEGSLRILFRESALAFPALPHALANYPNCVGNRAGLLL